MSATEQTGESKLNRIDRFNRASGRAIAWLTLFMVLGTGGVVLTRYAFDAGLTWLQEAVIWMHAAVFMGGAAYTLLQEEHVRVDIFYRRMSPRSKAWVDLLGVLLFILPVCGYLGWQAVSFALASFSMQEISREAGGLPFPMIPLLKAMVVVMPLAVGLQGLSMAARALTVIRGR